MPKGRRLPALFIFGSRMRKFPPRSGGGSGRGSAAGNIDRLARDGKGHADGANNLRNRTGQQVLQLRIGIHWGEVVIGNVGTAERLDWTAIGDVVNTASRIGKNCPPGEILVSTDVRDAIQAKRPDEFVFGGTFGIRVKGKRGEIQVCTAAQKGG